MKILLIDDDLLLTFSYEHVLTTYNHEVMTANSGPEGLHLFDAFQPDLVIVDFMMDAMNGLEVIAKIRQTKQSQVPVILLSGLSDKIEREDVSNKNIFMCIQKPIALEDLAEKINSKTEEILGPYRVKGSMG